VCLIVDANLASEVFSSPPAAEFRPVITWLSSQHGRLVFGGKNARELRRVSAAARYILQLSRAGRAIQFPDESITQEELRLVQNGECRSNDQHVLALAIISRARTLCTSDRELMEDFKNRQIIPSPRGKIYRRSEHVALLAHTRGCKGGD
jgi:predicted nucleic acid-binding protein